MSTRSELTIARNEELEITYRRYNNPIPSGNWVGKYSVYRKQLNDYLEFTGKPFKGTFIKLGVESHFIKEYLQYVEMCYVIKESPMDYNEYKLLPMTDEVITKLDDRINIKDYVCLKCCKKMPKHTVKEHKDLTNPIHNCPHK